MSDLGRCPDLGGSTVLLLIEVLLEPDQEVITPLIRTFCTHVRKNDTAEYKGLLQVIILILLIYKCYILKRLQCPFGKLS